MADEENRSVHLEATAAIAAVDALTPKITTRHYLASEHLWAAMESAAECTEIERVLLAASSGPVHPTHRARAVTAVMSSVAFLEALVNEVFQDAADDAPNRLEPLSGQCRALLKEYWSTGERTGILTKYQLALLFAGAEPMDRGTAPLQGAKLLVDLRNALVHFKPAWHDHEAPRDLELRLTGKFDKSSLLSANDGSPWPIWALAAPGAEWAVGAARTFADEWTERMGLRRVYEADIRSFGSVPRPGLGG